VSATRDWNAASYDRVSGPQVAWAREVLERLPLEGHETVLDAGCGSGRVTRMLLERLPAGRVVAVDASPSMIEKAREALPAERCEFHVQNLAELELPEPVDAAFSNAVFHWITDHDALFSHIHSALRPGGMLVAQCGGQGNIDDLRVLADEVAFAEPFAEHFTGWTGPWNYAGPEVTAERLERAGFTGVRCWLQEWPVTPDEPLEFLKTVCLGAHLDRMPPELQERYAEEVWGRAGDPLVLRYVRLNLDARRPA
jgi:trans-aconitate 2-methyltransferase